MRFPLVLAVATMLVAGPATVAPAQQHGWLTIHSVTVDAIAGTLTIRGSGFSDGLEVTLDGQAVTVLPGTSPTQLVVVVPAVALAVSGTYRLTVVDRARQMADAFEVMMGSAGGGSTVEPVHGPQGSGVGGGAPAPAPAAGGQPAPASATGEAGRLGSGQAEVTEDAGSPYATQIGALALANNQPDGLYNTASGYEALTANTTGSFNTATGARALLGNTTGSNNTAVGYQAGSSPLTGDYNVFLGANVSGASDDTNTIRIGSLYDSNALPPTGQNRTFIAGIRDTAVTGGLPVVIDADGQVGTAILDASAVSFNYAGSSSPGGPAASLACIGCVPAEAVNFGYAGSASAGGAATNALALGGKPSSAFVQFTDDGNVGIGNNLGPELVSNGEFTNDLAGWSGTNWAWSAGTALHTQGSTTPLYQATTMAAAGTTYQVTYTITGETDGSLRVYFGGVWGSYQFANAVHTDFLTATSTDALQIVPTEDFDGAIERVSVRAVTPTATLTAASADVWGPLTVHDRITFADGLPIAIGYKALPSSSAGEYNIPASNIGIGYYAGYNTTSGHITAVGYLAGEKNTTGVLTAFGKWAGRQNTTGHATFFGNAAGTSNTTSNSVAVGDEAASANTTGNVSALGYYAAASNVGGDVTAVGDRAAFSNVQGIVTAIGTKAGEAATGIGLTAVGYEAALATTTGAATAMGFQTLYSNTTGPATAIGYQAGFFNTSGLLTAIGHSAGKGNTTGSLTAVGYRAGFSNTTARAVALGHQAGYSNTTGLATVIGYNAAFKNVGDLIALGYEAGYGGNTANAPTADSAGILIGNSANRSVVSATVLTNYVGIGDGVLVNKSNQVVLGNSNITETVLRGNVLTNGGVASSQVRINTAGSPAGTLMVSNVVPAIASGGCTSPSVTWANGTAAFAIAIGTNCSGVKTVVLTMPAAANGWACHVEDNTTPASFVLSAQATSPTSVTISNWSRSSGAATNFTAGEVLIGKCSGG